MVLVWKVDLLVILNSHSFGYIASRGLHLKRYGVANMIMRLQFLVIRKSYMYDRYFTELKKKLRFLIAFSVRIIFIFFLFSVFTKPDTDPGVAMYIMYNVVCVSVGVYCIPFIYFIYLFLFHRFYVYWLNRIRFVVSFLDIILHQCFAFMFYLFIFVSLNKNKIQLKKRTFLFSRHWIFWKFIYTLNGSGWWI